MKLPTLALGLTTPLAIAMAASAQDLTIADLAPKDAMIVLGTSNMTTAKAAFDRTSLRNVWDNRELRTWMEGMTGDAMEQMRADLKTLGADLDELMVAPTGAAGMAMWANTERPEQDGAEWVLFADFGDNAGALDEQLTELMFGSVEEDMFELDEVDMGGLTVMSMTRIVDEDEEDADEDEGWDEEWEDGGDWNEGGWDEFGGDNADPLDMDELMYVRAGNRILFTSDAEQMQRMIDMIDEGAGRDGVGSSPAFNDAMAAIGNDQHAYAYISLISGDVLKELNQMPEFAIIGGMLSTLGIDAVRSASVGMRFDTDDAMLENSFAVNTSEKKGLIALFDNPPIAVDPPAFVSASASNFTALQFDLAKLIPTMERAINQMPAEEAGQMQMIFGQMKMILGPLLASMGPEIYMVGNTERPFSATSNKTVTMIRAKDDALINQTMMQFAPMMGLASRDFLGNTVWSAPAGGMIQVPAIGIGGGFVTIGDETTVENALRAVGRGGDGGLGDEPRFQTAVAPLGNQAIAYGFTDIKTLIEFTEWTSKNMRAVIEQQVNALPGIEDLDPEFKDQIIDEQMNAMPEFMKNMPSLKPLIDNMGDGSFEIRSTDTGFVGRQILLRPE